MAYSSSVIRAASSIREKLEEARAESFYEDAWYSYLDRRWIEMLVEEVLAGVYITGDGAVLRDTHDPAECEGRPCVIHNPSDHHMRDWPTRWRYGALDIKPPHMERVCEHGIGHPDPDGLAYLESIGDDVSIHGCDGCCTPPRTDLA